MKKRIASVSSNLNLFYSKIFDFIFLFFAIDNEWKIENCFEEIIVYIEKNATVLLQKSITPKNLFQDGI